MKKLLIIGGSHRDIPLIRASQDMGFYVITVGNLSFYIGYKYSNKHYNISFKDIDEVKKIIKDESVDYVIPGSGEAPMLISSSIIKNQNFDSFETTEILHLKDLFKIFCMKHHINTPKGKIAKTVSDIKNMDYPLIVKPLDLSGGNGINKVTCKQELESAILDAKIKSSYDEVIVEEFLESDLFAYSAILLDEKVHYGYLAKELENRFKVNITFKVQLDETILNSLIEIIERIAKILNLKDGLLHVQFMLKDNIPYIIEVTRRIPGDLFPRLIEFSDEVEYSKAVIDCYLGNGKNVPNYLEKKEDKYCLRYCIFSKEESVFDHIHIDDSVKLFEKIDIYTKGDKVEKNILVSIVIIEYSKSILNNLEKLIYLKGE